MNQIDIAEQLWPNSSSILANQWNNCNIVWWHQASRNFCSFK